MHGAVDSETTDIVAADLDAKLAVRDEQLAKLCPPNNDASSHNYVIQLV
jgi:hypothetical protein